MLDSGPYALGLATQLSDLLLVSGLVAQGVAPRAGVVAKKYSTLFFVITYPQKQLKQVPVKGVKLPPTSGVHTHTHPHTSTPPHPTLPHPTPPHPHTPTPPHAHAQAHAHAHAHADAHAHAQTIESCPLVGYTYLQKSYVVEARSSLSCNLVRPCC